MSLGSQGVSLPEFRMVRLEVWIMDDFEPLNSSSLLLSYYEFILDGSDAELKAQLDDLLRRRGLASHIRPLRCVQPVKSADLSKLPHVRWTDEFPYGVRPVPDWVKSRWENCYKRVVESPVKFDLTPPDHR